MADDELEGLKGIHDPEAIDELHELADEAESRSDAEAGEDAAHGDHPEQHDDPTMGHDEHDAHDSHDDHDAHDDHEPESASWVLVPLLVGAVLGIVLLAIFGLASHAASLI